MSSEKVLSNAIGYAVLVALAAGASWVVAFVLGSAFLPTFLGVLLCELLWRFAATLFKPKECRK